MIKQLTVKLDNRPGTLLDAVESLSRAGVDLKALEVNERGGGDFGEAHMIVSDVQKASRTLESMDQDHEVHDVLVIQMEDRVGGLAGVLKVLGETGVNIQFMYAFVTRVAGKSLCVFAVEDPAGVERTLADRGFVVVTESGVNQHSQTPRQKQAALEYYLGGEYFW